MKNLKRPRAKQKISKTILVVGCGNMADAIFTGRLRAAKEDGPLFNYIFINRTTDKSKKFAKKFKGKWFKDLSSIPSSQKVDWIFLLFKPQHLKESTSPIISFLEARPKVKIVSFLAAAKLAILNKYFPSHSIARIMPHLGVAEGLGSSYLFANNASVHSIMKSFWKPLGSLALTNNEDVLGHGVSLIGSSPALFAALFLSFAKSHAPEIFTAKEILKIQTEVLELVLLWLKQGKSLETMVEKVASSKGVTQVALDSWEKSGLTELLRAGIVKMNQRSDEISKELQS
jgi:pyrroline-5-carboxylate reductase